MIKSSCEASIFNLGIALRRLGSGLSSTCAGLHSPNSLPVPIKFVSFSIANRPKKNSSCASETDSGSKRGSGFCNNTVKEEEGDGDGDGRERHVHCEVEVISWRERRIRAEISVNSSVESVWDALTDYERLADFIPNLISSGRIPCPHPGRIWLEQRGLQRGLYWQIEARVVLDLLEFPNLADGRELHFSMVDGDFKKFEGKWSIKSMKRSSPTVLIYEVNVIPRFNFPAILLERIIRSDLPVNLRALACRAEKSFYGNKTNGTAENFIGEPSATNSLNASSCENVEPLAGGLKDIISGSGSGLLAPNSLKLNGNWGVFGKVCDLEKPCKVDEVHLRRFDGLLEDGGVHRCVVASITVKSSVREVWNALTDYERLPEIVPNLAISKILSRENNRVRILQVQGIEELLSSCSFKKKSKVESLLGMKNRFLKMSTIELCRSCSQSEGCKGLLYMVLHARVVLDLCEHLEQEISFEQVEGDFDSFHGKWVLEQLGNHHTLLKYSVESKMRKDTFLSEAIMEEVVYEDLPSNLCAIRDYIEKGEEGNFLEVNCIKKHSEEQIVSCKIEGDDKEATMAEQIFDSNEQAPLKPRPRVPGLQRDFEVLKAEVLKFISENGQEGFMPMRKQLRLHGRVDIEKAITRMGGFRRIAAMMNLSLAYKHRKPKGYWEKLENLQEEINRFQSGWGMDPSFMPSRKSFERAGRYDIARALEKWGGLHEVSRLLSLKVRHPNRQPGFGKDRKSDNVAFIEAEGDSKTQSKPYIAQDTEKWLIELEHLDINWVE